MSEDLEPIEKVEPPCKIYYLQSSSGEVYRCYRTSDADKVIADLKDKGDKIIFDLKDKLQKESALLKETRDCLIESQKMHKRCADNAIKMIRRINRKQCLKMAKLCKAMYDKEDASVNDGLSWYFISPEMKYWERWRWRWEALAEEPTWEKFLQLIHKEAK